MEIGGAGRSHVTGTLIGHGYLQGPGRKQQETRGVAEELKGGIICKGMAGLQDHGVGAISRGL